MPVRRGGSSHRRERRQPRRSPREEPGRDAMAAGSGRRPARRA